MAEELCIQTILPTLESDEAIRLVFEYDDRDGGSVNLEVTYPGQNRNPLEKNNDLSLELLRHACEKLVWQYRDGVCRIEGKLVSFE